MNNLERMKRDIISQIEKMDVQKFEELMDILVECNGTNHKILDISGLFDCNLCKEKYGKCIDESNECSTRFEKYANTECFHIKG